MLKLFQPDNAGLLENCLSCKEAINCSAYQKVKLEVQTRKLNEAIHLKTVKAAYQCSKCSYLFQTRFCPKCGYYKSNKVWVENPLKLNKNAPLFGQVTFL